MAEGQVGTLRANLRTGGMYATEDFLMERLRDHDDPWILTPIERIVGVDGPPPGPALNLDAALACILQDWMGWGPIVLIRCALVIGMAAIGAGLFGESSKLLTTGSILSALLSVGFSILAPMFNSSLYQNIFSALAGICSGISAACQIGMPVWGTSLLLMYPICALLATWEFDRIRAHLARPGRGRTNQDRVRDIIDRLCMDAVRDGTLILANANL